MGAARALRGAARFAAYSAGQAACVRHVAEHDLGAAAYAIKAARAANPGAPSAGRAERDWQRHQLDPGDPVTGPRGPGATRRDLLVGLLRLRARPGDSAFCAVRVRRHSRTGTLATMGLFRRHKAASFDTGHAGDDQLLTQLAQMTDLSAPRHWVHYLYFADEAAARGAAEVVSAAGWTLQNVEESAAGGPEWVVIAERHGAVTSPEAVRDARVFFESVAQRWPGGDYDGWEASA